MQFIRVSVKLINYSKEMLIFVLEEFMQLFVTDVSITFQMVLRKTIFQQQTVAVILENIYFFAGSVQD